jgi:uncharacterized protein (TIGR00251 family)
VALVQVRVQPRASQNAIDGFRDGVLRLRVTAAPAGGEANEAVITLLAKTLGIGRTRISIVRGQGARVKTLEIESMPDDEIRARLGAS